MCSSAKLGNSGKILLLVGSKIRGVEPELATSSVPSAHRLVLRFHFMHIIQALCVTQLSNLKYIGIIPGII